MIDDCITVGLRLILICVQSAKALAQALIQGNCDTSNSQVFVDVATEAEYTIVQNCAQKDSGKGNGFGSTGGSTAEGVRIHIATMSY
jgi:hypothetical protein